MIGVVFITFIVGGVGFFSWYHSQPSWKVQTITDPKISFEYPSVIRPNILTDSEKNDKFLFRAKEVQDTNTPPMLVTLRHEDGLRAPAALTHQELIDMLLGNIDKAYPQRFPGYEALSTHKFEQDGHKAAELFFTYDSPSGGKIKQRLLIADIDGNRVIYLSAQAKESDYPQLDKKYFTKIFSSLIFEQG